ncbi:ABC transporter ATP-binding protein [Streptomyces sp. NPDC056296]|uniref:ABC transporter ATP-binding protein n=1 Tax=Streptomyces sp. NPDC056296 TaxID=3345775 RepID=UPI0035DF9320
MTDDVLLDVRHVRQVYSSQAGPVTALDDIDLTVRRGEFVAVCGPSGCGKTTLLEILSGLRTPTQGEVRLGGERVIGPSREIGIVFQEDSTFPWRTVESNVGFGLEVMGEPRRVRDERVAELIRTVGLQGFESAYPAQLSGGMRQRVSIARGLAPRPSIMVMDEPFGALDEQTRLLLGGELLRIVDETQATVVLVTHSIQEAALLADRIVVLSARPARVHTVIRNPLPRPRTPSLLATAEFAEVSREIWASLEEQAQLAYDLGSGAA